MKWKIFAIAVLTVCGTCVPASAQDGYVGASYLSSSAEFDTSANSFNPDSDSWKIFIGYNFHKHFGIEASYYDFGTMEDESGNTAFEADIDVFDIAFRGLIPLGKRFQITAKIGYSNVDVEAETTNPLVIVSGQGSSWELIYGIGAEVKLGEKLGLRADWDTWDVEGSLEAWAVGLYIRF